MRYAIDNPLSVHLNLHLPQYEIGRIKPPNYLYLLYDSVGSLEDTVCTDTHE